MHTLAQEHDLKDKTESTHKRKHYAFGWTDLKLVTPEKLRGKSLFRNRKIFMALPKILNFRAQN